MFLEPKNRLEESIPPVCVDWRADTTNRVIVPARRAGNRFLGSLKGLQIRALLTKSKGEKYRFLVCQTFCICWLSEFSQPALNL
jgi:hypothetical protein